MGLGLSLGIGVTVGTKSQSWSSYWAKQLGDVFTAMPTKPETTDLFAQGELMKDLKDTGIYDKAFTIWVPSVHAEDSSLINWKNPGTYDLVKVNTPAWTLRKGFKGVIATSSCLRTGFIPSVAGVQQNSLFVGCGIQDDVGENRHDLGCYDGSSMIYIDSRRVDYPSLSFAVNDTAFGQKANASAIGHYGINRSAAATHTYNRDVKITSVNVNSTGVPTRELYLCGGNWNGTISVNTKTLSYVIITSALTEYEQNEVIRIFEKYLRAIGSGLIATEAKKFYVDQSSYDTIALDMPYNFEDETIHPAVMKFENGFRGYKYWLTVAGYPITHYGGEAADYENPYLFGSNDGINWVLPAGNLNPVIPKPTPETEFNSDPMAIYDNGYFYVFTCHYIDGNQVVDYRRSADLITWSDVTRLTVTNFEDKCSPSIIKVGSTFYLYSIKIIGIDSRAAYRTSCATIEGDFGDAEGEAITITGFTGLQYPYHFEIFHIDSVYYMAVYEGNSATVWIGHSTDGLTFTLFNGVRILTYTAPETSLYKPSLVNVSEDLYYLYTHAYSTQWRMKYVKMRIF